MTRPNWRQEGEEPDYRFTLANERTFLAWLRTALALLAGGVALDQLGGHLQASPAMRMVTILLCLLAAVLALQAWRHWRGNLIAMRNTLPLPGAPMLAVLATGVTFAAVVLLGMSLLGQP